MVRGDGNQSARTSRAGRPAVGSEAKNLARRTRQKTIMAPTGRSTKEMVWAT